MITMWEIKNPKTSNLIFDFLETSPLDRKQYEIVRVQIQSEKIIDSSSNV